MDIHTIDTLMPHLPEVQVSTPPGGGDLALIETITAIEPDGTLSLTMRRKETRMRTVTLAELGSAFGVKPIAPKTKAKKAKVDVARLEAAISFNENLAKRRAARIAMAVSVMLVLLAEKARIEREFAQLMVIWAGLVQEAKEARRKALKPKRQKPITQKGVRRARKVLGRKRHQAAVSPKPEGRVVTRTITTVAGFTPEVRGLMIDVRNLKRALVRAESTPIRLRKRDLKRLPGMMGWLTGSVAKSEQRACAERMLVSELVRKKAKIIANLKMMISHLQALIEVKRNELVKKTIFTRVADRKISVGCSDLDWLFPVSPITEPVYVSPTCTCPDVIGWWACGRRDCKHGYWGDLPKGVGCAEFGFDQPEGELVTFTGWYALGDHFSLYDAGEAHIETDQGDLYHDFTKDYLVDEDDNRYVYVSSEDDTHILRRLPKGVGCAEFGFDRKEENPMPKSLMARFFRSIAEWFEVRAELPIEASSVTTTAVSASTGAKMDKAMADLGKALTFHVALKSEWRGTMSGGDVSCINAVGGVIAPMSTHGAFVSPWIIALNGNRNTGFQFIKGAPESEFYTDGDDTAIKLRTKSTYALDIYHRVETALIQKERFLAARLVATGVGEEEAMTKAISDVGELYPQVIFTGKLIPVASEKFTIEKGPRKGQSMHLAVVKMTQMVDLKVVFRGDPGWLEYTPEQGEALSPSEIVTGSGRKKSMESREDIAAAVQMGLLSKDQALELILPSVARQLRKSKTKTGSDDRNDAQHAEDLSEDRPKAGSEAKMDESVDSLNFKKSTDKQGSEPDAGTVI